jgi:dipeptidyl aminopeptidase/acylaminoacyl peptidase
MFRTVSRCSAAFVVVATLLVGASVGERALAASPGQNGKIAYESAVEGNFEIFVMNADGSGQTNISNDETVGGNNRDPVWSPDGTKIAFARAGEGHMNVWVMNADGSGQVNLTPGAATADGTFGAEPTWSPDGSKLAYNSGGSIFVMSASGGGKNQLTPVGEADAQPAWSPDGTKIAFVNQNDIWVMNADGSGRMSLAASVRGEARPDWSPDGTKLAYVRDTQIWVMNADGSGQTPLMGAAETGSEPAWSPDGTRIVFESNGNGAPNGHDIFVMNADGTNIQRLDTPVPASDLNPSWQPVTDSIVDTMPPSIVISAPQDGRAYDLGATVVADFTCSDETGGSGVASCEGTVADGAGIDTSSLGAQSFTVVAVDREGNRSSATIAYTVVRPNVPPAASFTFSPSSPTSEDIVSFDASGSSDPDGDPLTYSWVVDGTAAGTTATISRTLPAGSHTVQLTVSDGRGGSSTSSATVTVTGWTIDGELAGLISTITSWRLPRLVRVGLVAPLEAARILIRTSRQRGACALLDGYGVTVRYAVVFRVISQQQAGVIIARVTRVMRALGC